MKKYLLMTDKSNQNDIRPTKTLLLFRIIICYWLPTQMNKCLAMNIFFGSVDKTRSMKTNLFSSQITDWTRQMAHTHTHNVMSSADYRQDNYHPALTSSNIQCISTSHIKFFNEKDQKKHLSLKKVLFDTKFSISLVQNGLNQALSLPIVASLFKCLAIFFWHFVLTFYEKKENPLKN